VLEEKRLRNDGTSAARSEQASQGSDEVHEKNDQIAHHRIVAGRGILRNYGRNNNSPASGWTSDPLVSQGTHPTGLKSLKNWSALADDFRTLLLMSDEVSESAFQQFMD